MKISWAYETIFVTRNFEQSAEPSKRNVVVELAGGQQVVFDDCVVENGRPVGSDSLLVRLEQGLELLLK